MRNLLLAIALVFLMPLGLAVAQQGEAASQSVEATQTRFTPLDEDYDEATLAALGEQAFQEALSVYPSKLESLTFRFVSLSKMRRILREELLPQMRIQFEDEDAAASNARSFASATAKAIFAKLDLASGDIIVVRKNLFEISELLDCEELASREVLKAILCHEAVHAIDHARQPLSKLLALAKDADGLQAVSAVMEGHAQFMARKACAKSGNLEAFKVFTGVIDLVPEEGSAAETYMRKLMVAKNAFAYVDGERFFEGLEKNKTKDFIALAFQAPPMESILISEPDWFMDPSSRPKVAVNLQLPLEQYQALLEKGSPGKWAVTQVAPLTSQLAAAFSVLPKEAYAETLREIRGCRMLVASNAEGGSSMITAALFAMSSPTWARRLFTLEMDVTRAKDIQMSEGPVRITASKMEELVKAKPRRLQGKWVVKTVAVQNPYEFDLLGGGPQETEIKVISVFAVRGTVLLEMSFVGEEIDREAAIELAERMLNGGWPEEPHEAKDEVEPAQSK